jgi:hypothetical protein
MVIVVSFSTTGEGKHVIKEIVTRCRKYETVSIYTVDTSRLIGVSNEEEAQGADPPPHTSKSSEGM